MKIVETNRVSAVGIVGLGADYRRRNPDFAEATKQLVKPAMTSPHCATGQVRRGSERERTEGGGITMDRGGTGGPIPWWREASAFKVEVIVVSRNVRDAEGGIDITVGGGTVHVRLVTKLDPFTKCSLLLRWGGGEGGIRNGFAQGTSPLPKTRHVQGDLEAQVLLGRKIAQ